MLDGVLVELVWSVGGVLGDVERCSPWSLCAEGRPGGWVGDVPEEGVSPFCRAGLCASGAAFSGVALVCCASAWFGASLTDSDAKEAKLLEVFTVHSKCLAGVAASKVTEEAWDGVEGLGCRAPVAAPNLFPIKGVVVVRCGGLGPGSSLCFVGEGVL